MSGPFLIGGGRDDALVLPTHRPFVAACGGGSIACLVADEGEGIDGERWRGALAAAGAAPGSVRVVAIGAGRPVRAEDVEGVAGVYVAGGLTPLYADVLAGWRPPEGVVYAGFSAGACLAARRAIVGGWRGADGAPVCPEEAGEDLDTITVVDGLGLVPFAVDVHAAQWGTLGRLVAAVQEGLVDEGWGLDEGALLVDGEVHGPGAASARGPRRRRAARAGGVGGGWRASRRNAERRARAGPVRHRVGHAGDDHRRR